MKEEALRETLIQQAEYAFLRLMGQVDALFDLTGFYLDRYPPDGVTEELKARELKVTVDNIAAHAAQLGEVLKRWKHDEERVLSRMGTELSVLNELWANIQALVYFLVSHNIDSDAFDLDEAVLSFGVLVKCNRLLT